MQNIQIRVDAIRHSDRNGLDGRRHCPGRPLLGRPSPAWRV